MPLFVCLWFNKPYCQQFLKIAKNYGKKAAAFD